MAVNIYMGEYNGSLLYVAEARLEECERGMALMDAVRKSVSWDGVVKTYPEGEVRSALHAALVDAWNTDTGGGKTLPIDYWPDLHDVSHHYGWLDSIPKLDDYDKMGKIPLVLTEAIRFHDPTAGANYVCVYWDFADSERLNRELARERVTVRDGTARFSALVELYQTL